MQLILVAPSHGLELSLTTADVVRGNIVRQMLLNVNKIPRHNQ